jgi:hypothetical protein
VRAIALAKMLINHGKVHILTNSNYCNRLLAIYGNYPNLTVHPVPNLSPSNLGKYYKQLLDEYQITCLIVDTFPRGIVGELVGVLDTITMPKIMLVRDLNPRYVHQYNLGRFMQDHYDLCIPIELVAFNQNLAIEHPITICSAHEILETASAQKILGVHNPERKTIFICPSGTLPDQQLFQDLYTELRELLPAYNVHLIDYFPAMQLYSAVDVVIGSGGYNTVGECLAMNLPLLGVPFLRLYDRQALRLQRYKHRGIHLIENPLDILPKIQEILHNSAPKLEPVNFHNGAKEVLDRLWHSPFPIDCHQIKPESDI